MKTDFLTPQLDLLTQDYVLVQAWKKTVSHIRYHNWYADTLELDLATVNLRQFIAELAERFSKPEQWVNDPLRIVPAPKSQAWIVTKDAKWEPDKSVNATVKLRPLAHVSLQDQVAATALMMCLADRVETLQGDPRGPISDIQGRERVISYGNRLFCDVSDNFLRHRWGSAKLYRSYFQDYRTFLNRPEVVAEENASPKVTLASLIKSVNGLRTVVVHSDLRQFYDRVQPNLLAAKLNALAQVGDDPNFFKLATRVLNWEWDVKDIVDVKIYAHQAELTDFSKVALPQGLVSAGFFANVALLDFDQALRKSFFKDIAMGLTVQDASRYVDDLRIVLTVGVDWSLDKIEEFVVGWLQRLLNESAPGLFISKDKTKAAYFRGDERPLIRQSRKMERIQWAVSGGFDAIGGEDILDAVQGLIRSQQRYSEKRTETQGWQFSPIPDVRDASVARFAAARFRSTYRSLRPMLEERCIQRAVDDEDDSDESLRLSRVARTQSDLDDEARAFALGLVENWLEDPSNVRLLRVGLDIWPAGDVLTHVLELLKPFTEKSGQRKEPRRVAWYCLSEILRAGATETGFVEDGECLPAGVDLVVYRRILLKEAIRLISLPQQSLPWYLRQQALLFIAVNNPGQAPFSLPGRSPETIQYKTLINYLRGNGGGMKVADFASLAVLSRRSFLDSERATSLACVGISSSRLEEIADRDPSFASEILESRTDLLLNISARLRDDLSIDWREDGEGWLSLSKVVIQNGRFNPLRNEISILQFASKFLRALDEARTVEVVTPSDVYLKIDESNGHLQEVKIKPSRVSAKGSIYQAPRWCSTEHRWRFQLGYLLRFVLTGKSDFTKSVRPSSWKEKNVVYRVPESHWFQRRYSLYSGFSAFGDDWLPISEWIEQLLISLLSWPGCLASEIMDIQVGPSGFLALFEQRLNEIAVDQGSSGILLLRRFASKPDKTTQSRPLRACVVQTVLPSYDDFPNPEGKTAAELTEALKFSDPTYRKKHRNHLSATLAAIERMLDLRETHKGQAGRLDWLILPELSIHPADVKTHLEPFARAHKTIILAGLTHEELFAGEPLVNSALWVIPKRSSTQGLQVVTLRQGKGNLSPEELKFNTVGPVLQGFRPYQLLVGYDWSNKPEDVALWLTASICYDATDLSLANDLRNRSDVFAIPALNRDVKTYDQMALALHYHMFQLVIVANNGDFGGSNAYMPCGEDFQRQVFHLHGQPQATMAFFEIEDIFGYLKRKKNAIDDIPLSANGKRLKWKYPPAGM